MKIDRIIRIAYFRFVKLGAPKLAIYSTTVLCVTGLGNSASAKSRTTMDVVYTLHRYAYSSSEESLSSHEANFVVALRLSPSVPLSFAASLSGLSSHEANPSLLDELASMVRAG
jgi:hypothetical protein